MSTDSTMPVAPPGPHSPSSGAVLTSSTAPGTPAGPASTPMVRWYATWQCHACGEGGDAHFDDGTIVDADHECEDDGSADGEVAWDGRADCPCGWSLETGFEDGDHVEADHDCAGDG
ncbi:hypothetical protein ACGF12_13865 [Kitasatospora sp. NPDC048296]|uniref:hypothetical protein n=1 Tax=Kitasatospora sp. NPDC048296 TaxID=3364048 RepID=UPI003719F9E4